MSKRKIVYRFKVELSREITQEEFENLASAVLAQCEELDMDDGTWSQVGYIIGSDEHSVGAEYDIRHDKD